MLIQSNSRKSLLYLILALGAFFVSGCKKEESVLPESTVEGLVLDEFRGVLAGVTCKLSSALGDHTATTNSAGYFKIHNVVTGNYTLSASKANYISANVSIEVTLNAATVELVLSSGDSFLQVADSLLKVASTASLRSIQVKSNTHWEVSTETPWITVSASTSSGNGNIVVSCQASSEDHERVGIVEVKSGSLRSTVRVIQEPPLKLMSTDIVYGNLVLDTPDSIVVEFNKAFTITSIQSNYTACGGNPTFKLAGSRLALHYECARIGGSYPITINAKVGPESFQFQVNMNYYDKKKTLPEGVVDYFIAPDNQSLWAISNAPNKLVQLSLPDLTVIKETVLDFAPSAIRWNHYAQQINAFTQGYCSLPAVEAGTCSQNRLIYIDPNSLATSFSPVHHIPDYYFYGNNAYPYVFPRDIALFSDGTGIIQLSNDYNYLLWRFFDSQHHDTTFIGYIHNNLPAYDLRFQAIFENYNKSQIYLMHPSGQTSIDIYDRGNSTFRTYHTPGGIGYANQLVPHKKANWMHHVHLYQQYVSDLDSYDSWYTYFDTRYWYSGFDFSYRPGEEEIVYHLGDGWFFVLDYRYGATLHASRFFDTMQDIQTTTDGVGMTALKGNNQGGVDLFYFKLDRLLNRQVLRTSPGGRSAPQSRSKFDAKWAKR